MSEGNFTDEMIIETNKIQLKKHNTVALLLSIRLTLFSMNRYLDDIFQLQMVRVEELPFLFMQTSYIYQVPTAYSHINDLSS